MRTHLPALFLALTLAPPFAAPATAATRNFGITGFDRVRVEGPYKVQLTTGVAPFAKAAGSPAALDRVSIGVEGRTLVVRTSRSWGGYPGQDRGPVEVSIGTHDLNAAHLTGSGTLQINKVKGLSFKLSVQGSGGASIAQVAVDQFDMALAGTASATLAGRTGKLTASVRGLSAFDGQALTAKDASLAVVGAATVKANVTNSAKIGASGPAAISLSGRPSCSLQLDGSASVSGCR